MKVWFIWKGLAFSSVQHNFCSTKTKFKRQYGALHRGKKHEEDIPILLPDSILHKPGPRLSPLKLIWVYSKSVELHTNICADTQQSKAPLLNLPWKKASRQLQIKHQGCQAGNFVWGYSYVWYCNPPDFQVQPLFAGKSCSSFDMER